MPKLLLKAPVTWDGKGCGPLHFTDNDCSSLTLLERLWKPRAQFNPKHPTTDWADKDEAFYINCKHTKSLNVFEHDSFICVKKSDSPPEGFEVSCTPNIKDHNHGACMLFSLVNSYKLKKTLIPPV